MKIKKIFIALVFPILAAPVAGASIGVAIAPATGTFSVPLDGTELEFTIYNTGDVDSSYMIELGGGAAEFSSVEGTEILIPANDYRGFKVKVDPSPEVGDGDTYDLTVMAKIASSGNIVTGAESRVTLSFYGVRTRPYPEEDIDVEEKLPEPPEKGPTPTGMVPAKPTPMASVPPQESAIPLGIALPILVGIIIGGVVLALIKRIFY